MTTHPLRFVLCVGVSICFFFSAGCERRGVLTQEAAQDAINQWATSKFAANKNAVKIIGGVRELPAENSATAELQFDSFNYTLTQSPDTGRIYNGRGIATFAHYTDGRWVLNRVQIGQAFDTVTWSPNIEAK